MSDNDLIQKGQDDLIRRGDVREALRECDAWSMDIAYSINTIPAVQPTVLPKAQPDDVAALVEALRNLLIAVDTGWRLTTACNDARAALARVKSKEGFSDEKGVM